MAQKEDLRTSLSLQSKARKGELAAMIGLVQTQHRVAIVMATAMVLGLALVGVAVAADESPLNAKVVIFCKLQMGKMVGNGECTNLAEAALDDAGAVSQPIAHKPAPGDYVWGEQVFLVEAGGDNNKLKTEGKFADIQPGDIVQLRNATFVRKVGNSIESRSAAHHTAVVAKVGKDRRTLTVYEQNINGKRIVMQNPYDLGGIRQGWLRVYRPQAAARK